MIQLTNTKYGSRRQAIIGGFSHFDNLNKSATLLMYVQIMNESGVLLDDLSVNQNREVIYNLNNENRVNSSFNPIATGGTGEYDYFFNLLQTVPLPELVLQLAVKLNEREIFD